jgi:serine protease Do
LDSDKGAFISEVWDDTPASRGGICPGDVIIEFNGQKVSNANDLQNAIRASGVGNEVEAKVIRNKRENWLAVKIVQQPDNMSGKKFVTVNEFVEPTNFSMGLTVTNLSSEKTEAMSYEKRRGVLVKDVESNSPAERAGISPGDVILKVGSKDVNSVEEFKSVLNEFTERGLSVSVFVKSKGFVTLK